MYDNIGKKIKNFAIWCFVGESVASVIGAISFLATQSDDDYVIPAVIALFLGPIIAFISSWFVYGFGEIIEKLTEIERNTRGNTKSRTQLNNDDARIEKLESLRAQGLITEEEYQKAIANNK